jgi:hypothetical protein
MTGEPQPRIVIARAGFLALSDPGTGLRIGVVAPTEREAQERYAREAAAWRELRERRLASAG